MNPVSGAAVQEADSCVAPLRLASRATVQSAPRSAGRLLSNIGWMLMGNVLYGFSQWGLLIVLAKLGTVEMVGSFAMAMAVCLPALMFTSLSLRSLHVTDYGRNYRFLEYVALRLIAVCLSFAFVTSFGIFTGSAASVVVATGLVGAAKGVEYLSDILYGLLQQQENMSGIGISMSVRALFAVAALSAGLYLTHSLVWGASFYLASSLIVLAAYDIPKVLSVSELSFRAAKRQMSSYIAHFFGTGGHRRLYRLAVTGLPMGLVLMMVSLNLNIPRYFINQHLGAHELAMFSAIATLLAAGGVVTNAMGQAAAPRLAKYFAEGERNRFLGLLGGVALTSLALGALGFAGALMFGREAMAFIYRPEYSTRQDILVWLMAASGFFYLGSTLGYAVTAVRCFAPQLPLFAGAAVVTAIGCVVLVPSHGLQGAAMAILISGVVQCGGSGWLLYNAYRKADRIAPQVCSF